MGWDIYSFGSSTEGQANTWTSFVVQLDDKGRPQWAKNFAGFDTNLAPAVSLHDAIAVTVDKDDYAVVAGHFQGTAFIGGTSQSSYGGDDAFVLKLDKTGTPPSGWPVVVHGQGGADDGNQWATSVTTDPCSGDVYVAGGYQTAIQLDGKVSPLVAGATDMWLARLKATDGSMVWGKVFGDVGWQVAAFVGADRAGNVLLAGRNYLTAGATGIDFGSDAGFDPVFQPDAGAATNDCESFAAKLDASGRSLWWKRLGSTTSDQDLVLTNTAAVDPNGRSVVVGYYHSTNLVVGDGKPSYNAFYYDSYAVYYAP
jgi:hypothetical protein